MAQLGKVMTCAEIAKRYGVNVATVWRWMREGMLPSFHVGKSYFTYPEMLAEFEQKQLLEKRNHK